MAKGLRLRAPDGTVILEFTDRITRLYSTGTYQAPEGSGAYPRVEIGVPGMQPDGTWFVVVTGSIGIANRVIVQSNKFTVICMDRFAGNRPVNRYSVYRC